MAFRPISMISAECYLRAYASRGRRSSNCAERLGDSEVAKLGTSIRMADDCMLNR